MTQVADAARSIAPTGDVSRSASWHAAIRAVARDRVTQVLFVVTALGVTFAYSVLLPFDFTERVSFQNWHYLDTYLLLWAVVLGPGMALVLSIQVYAMRTVTAARAASGVTGGLAFVGSLLPSFLCCTPIIPTVLAFVGVSGVGLYSTTGTLQHFFATHQTEFLAGSLVLLVLTAIWGLLKVVTATCVSASGCVAGQSSGGGSTMTDLPGTEGTQR